MRRDPRIALLIVDPDDTSRYIEIRGDGQLTEEAAIEHLDTLTRQYTAHPQFYGYVCPHEQRQRETRLIGRIVATKMTLDAIHR